MISKKKIVVFYTSGLGNALFQLFGSLHVAYSYKIENIYLSSLLARRNFITNLLRWSIFNDLLKYNCYKQHDSMFSFSLPLMVDSFSPGNAS